MAPCLVCLAAAVLARCPGRLVQAAPGRALARLGCGAALGRAKAGEGAGAADVACVAGGQPRLRLPGSVPAGSAVMRRPACLGEQEPSCSTGARSHEDLGAAKLCVGGARSAWHCSCTPRQGLALLTAALLVEALLHGLYVPVVRVMWLRNSSGPLPSALRPAGAGARASCRTIRAGIPLPIAVQDPAPRQAVPGIPSGTGWSSELAGSSATASQSSAGAFGSNAAPSQACSLCTCSWRPHSPVGQPQQPGHAEVAHMVCCLRCWSHLQRRQPSASARWAPSRC